MRVFHNTLQVYFFMSYNPAALVKFILFPSQIDMLHIYPSNNNYIKNTPGMERDLVKVVSK